MPEWERLMDARRGERRRATAPITTIWSAHIPKGLVVLRGSGFMYYTDDPGRGFYIRTIFGNNLAFILGHFMRHDGTTDVRIHARPGKDDIMTISGHKDGGWRFYATIVELNWDRYTKAVVKVQRLARRVLMRRMTRRTGVNHDLFKYKRASAFMSSEFARWMQSDVVYLIVREFVVLHDLKKDSPVCRIETDSFKKINRFAGPRDACTSGRSISRRV